MSRLLTLPSDQALIDKCFHMNKEVELVKKYFHLLETFQTDTSAYEEILHPDIIQTEYPNLVTPQVRSRSLEGLMAGAKAGKQLLALQTFEIIGILAGTGHLTVELQWRGTVAIDIASFTKGQQLMAYICTIFEFKEGKIFRQRNYDCYEPFTPKPYQRKDEQTCIDMNSHHHLPPSMTPLNNPDIHPQSDQLVLTAIQRLESVLERIRREEMDRYTRKLPQPELNLADELSREIMQKILLVPLFRLNAIEKESTKEKQAKLLNEVFTYPAAEQQRC